MAFPGHQRVHRHELQRGSRPTRTCIPTGKTRCWRPSRVTSTGAGLCFRAASEAPSRRCVTSSLPGAVQATPRPSGSLSGSTRISAVPRGSPSSAVTGPVTVSELTGRAGHPDPVGGLLAAEVPRVPVGNQADMARGDGRGLQDDVTIRCAADNDHGARRESVTAALRSHAYRCHPGAGTAGISVVLSGHIATTHPPLPSKDPVGFLELSDKRQPG